MRFMKYIGEIWRCSALFRTEQYEKLGIGCYQDLYLIEICEKPGITQEEISAALFVHKSNVARQVASLEEKGMAERRIDPSDRRILRVYPTEKGLSVLEKTRSVRKEWTRRLLEGMSDEEKEALSHSIECLSDRAKSIAREYGEGEDR